MAELWLGGKAPRRVAPRLDGHKVWHDDQSEVVVLAVALGVWVMMQVRRPEISEPFVAHAVDFRKRYTPGRSERRLSTTPTKPPEATPGNTPSEHQPAIPAVNRGEG